MLVKEWNELPDYMQVEEVRPYYEILRKKKGQLVLKRIFDICVSLVLIVLLSPIIIFFSIWIKLDSKGPVFYRQERITQYGKVFRIFKFRTMVNNADKIGNLVHQKMIQVTTGLILHIQLNIAGCRITRNHRRSKEQHLCIFDDFLRTHKQSTHHNIRILHHGTFFPVFQFNNDRTV